MAFGRRALDRLSRAIGKQTAGEFPPDFSADEKATLDAVTPFSMTSPERLVALTRAVEHVARHRIPGDIVECGVWRGGSMMAVARTLLASDDATRELYLFDTFEGMPAPGDADRSFDGRAAQAALEEAGRASHEWAVASYEEVETNLRATGYPEEQLHLVRGRVEDTIPGRAPARIALLRLDTDWYESTRHELEHLYPRLVPGGVLILDDYGHWEGARRAVDEYVEAHGLRLLLCRIDYTGRLAVKPDG